MRTSYNRTEMPHPLPSSNMGAYNLYRTLPDMHNTSIIKVNITGRQITAKINIHIIKGLKWHIRLRRLRRQWYRVMHVPFDLQLWTATCRHMDTAQRPKRAPPLLKLCKGDGRLPR